jgi:tetratricopeptide (TPR) repeat protein
MKNVPKSSAKRGASKPGSGLKKSPAPAASAKFKQPDRKMPSKPSLSQPKKTDQMTSDGQPPAPPTDSTTQRSHFDKAIGLFNARQFADAKILFERAASGPNLEIAHAARLHIRMCDQRLAASQPVPSSPDALYDVAITLINRRELDTAEARLNQALLMQESGGHLHYAMALCRGLRGDEDGAARHLRRAIELDPRHRTTARNDPDFMELHKSASIHALIFPPERKASV